MDTSTVIGTDAETDLPVSISEGSRPLSTYIIGTPGMGKSTVLEHIAHQDIEHGDGLCLIDPHGLSAKTLLRAIPRRRETDVIYWYPYDISRPFGVNPFVCDPQDELAVSTTAQSFVFALESLAEFSDVFAQGTRMKDKLLNLGYTFALNQGQSLIEATRFLSYIDEAKLYRQNFYPNLLKYNPQVLEFWKEFDGLSRHERYEQSESTANKLRRFSNDSVMRRIFGQTTNSLDFRRVIDEGKIVILDLSRIGLYNAAFIGAFVVWGIWTAASLRGEVTDKRIRPFHIVADEFENYMTMIFPDIQKQGRKFKIDSAIAHQERSGLGEEMKGSTLSVKNKVVFSVSGKDAVELAREFKKVIPQPEMRQQQKFTLVTNILEHLAIHAHEDALVTAQSNALRHVIDIVFEYAIQGREREETAYAHARSKGVALPPPPTMYSQQATLARKQFEGVLDALLFSMMSAHSEAELRALWNTNGLNEQLLVSAVEELYARLFSHADKTSVARIRLRERSDLPSIMLTNSTSNALVLYEGQLQIPAPQVRAFLWNRTALLWEWETYLRHIVFQLGLSLWRAPCSDRSGQLEAISGPVRSYSDVEAEIANKLTTLPRYRAQVTLIENGSPAQYTIATLPPLTPTKATIARGERIRQQSRDRYGRDANQVEIEMKQRQAHFDAANAAHDANTKSPPVKPRTTKGATNPTPSETPRTPLETDDDDGIILRD